MDKKILESYPQIVAEIQELQENLQTALHGMTAIDTVSGSMDSFPYLKCAITVSGPCGQTGDKDLVEEMRRRLARLLQAKARIESFVGSLPSFRERRIVRLKAMQGLCWREVARLVGGELSPEAVRSIYRRALLR